MVDIPSGDAIAQLQRQADDTGRVAALAAVTGERAAIAYQERAEELERRLTDTRATVTGWRWTAVASAVAAVALAVTLAATWTREGVTHDMLTDARDQLERSEAARERLEAAMVGVTRRDTLAGSVGYLVMRPAE
jgi:hypothetical protein